MAKRKYNRKRKSRPSSTRRHQEQNVKDRLAHAQDDAQRLGLIPLTPEEALRSARVDPSSQDEQRFPGLDRQGIQNDGKGGWAVPEHVKRKVIEQNAEVLFEKKTMIVEGETIELPPNRFEQQQASKILLLADQKQYERDNPEEAGKARGSVTQTNNTQVNVVGAAEVLKKVQEQRECKAIEDRIQEGLVTPIEGDGLEQQSSPSTSGNGDE